MIKTFEDRLSSLTKDVIHAKEALQKESVLQNFDTLLIDVFNLVNESIAKNRDPEFIRHLQALELRIAEERESAYQIFFT